MDLRQITIAQKKQYNKTVTHVIQSWEWGEFRQGLGLPLKRYGLFKKGKLSKAFQLTFHKIPFTNRYVGYLPKGPLPDKELSQALAQIGKEENCAFIKVEPDVLASSPIYSVHPSFLPSPKPLFTKYNFLLDLTPNEDELLKNMHPKTRYNIKVAQNKGVKVKEGSDKKALETYLKLYFQTTGRQNYHGHNEYYHRMVWMTLHEASLARFLIAYYTPPRATRPVPLTAWMLLNFGNTLYYPYGGSSTEYKEVMSNNLVAWEAIKLGKKLGLKKFDMWGALGPDANPNDPWQGFHRFKKGYGGKLVEYLGTFDLVFNDPLYWLFTSIDKLTPLKVFLLKMFK